MSRWPLFYSTEVSRFLDACGVNDQLRVRLALDRVWLVGSRARRHRVASSALVLPLGRHQSRFDTQRPESPLQEEYQYSTHSTYPSSMAELSSHAYSTASVPTHVKLIRGRCRAGSRDPSPLTDILNGRQFMSCSIHASLTIGARHEHWSQRLVNAVQPAIHVERSAQRHERCDLASGAVVLVTERYEQLVSGAQGRNRCVELHEDLTPFELLIG